MKAIKKVPDEFSVVKTTEKWMLLNKIDNAQQKIKEGKGLTTVQVKKKLQKWLK